MVRYLTCNKCGKDITEDWDRVYVRVTTVLLDPEKPDEHELCRSCWDGFATQLEPCWRKRFDMDKFITAVRRA